MMGPQRIVCLTEEPTETLYLLSQQNRIVGISGFTVRPAMARKEKPKVSAFTSAKIDKILALKPDMVIGYSDMQAEIAQALIKAGKEVWIANHRSVTGIMDYVLRLGALVGCLDLAASLVAEWRAKLDARQQATAMRIKRPKVYFEEWDEPLMSGIQWVCELIRLAGGDDVFPELANQSLGKDRIIADGQTVIDAQPDIIIGSWCGKKFRPEKVAARDGWAAIPAVQNQQLIEIKSPLILQPGPAALTDGFDALCDAIDAWHAGF